jgi:starch synthase
VVRSVGGMVDTVFDRDYSPRPRPERNGYAFEHVDNPALESALGRAIRLRFDQPVEFRRLIDSAMRADNSWNRPGRQYLNVYEHIRRDRRAVPGLLGAPWVSPPHRGRTGP